MKTTLILLKIFLHIINPPIFFLSKLIPKNDKLWIFGAWSGEKYSDNSKYLFEYVNKNHPEIRAVWLTLNKQVLESIRKKGYEAYYSYSLMGYFLSAKSKICFLSVYIYDVNEFMPQNIMINLWHGTPLKKIEYDVTTSKIKVRDVRLFNNKLLKTILCPSYRKSSDYTFIAASSPEEAKNLSTAFRKPLDYILLTGLPRNDVFFKNKQKNNPLVKKIIYMPTWRADGGTTKLFTNSSDYINQALNRYGLDLYIKLHTNDMINIHLDSYSNVKLLLDSDIEQDIYTVINDFDILITDYSSIYFDFLLSDRPIIFAPFDYETYISEDRELYYDYNEVTPGPKCKNWEEVLDWILKFKENPKLYSKERETMRNRFHMYQDGKNCQRVCNEIINLKNKGLL